MVASACASPAAPAGTQVYDAGAQGSETTDDIAADPDAAPTPGDDTVGQTTTTSLPPGDPVQWVANTQYFPKARDVILTAQTKLRIVQFELAKGDTVGLLVAAIIKAKQRGVDVKVLLDDEVTYNADVVAQLKAAGVVAKLDGPKLRTHAKVVASEQGALIGSTNWSATSMTKNNETNLLLRDPAAVTAVHAWVDKLYGNPTVSVPMPKASSKLVTLYADGGYFGVAAPLVDAAKQRILLCTYGMNIDQNSATAEVTQLAQKLGKAVARGVDVQVLLDQSADPTEIGNDINAASGSYLAKLGCKVRNDPGTVTTHAKFLIVDDALVLGSNNWGYGGFAGYHEIGAKTLETAPVQAAADYFGKIWLVSTDLVP